MDNILQKIYPTEVPEYIGLKLEKGEYKFIFPCNYQKSKTEKEEKNDILNILKLITKYKTKELINDNYLKKYCPPFEAYLWIIKDYIENGYYQIINSEYQKDKEGKINWAKTIKHNSIYLTEDNIIYKDLIRKKNKKQDDILTEIHKVCVYESVYIMGWFYNININSVEKKEYNIHDKNQILKLLRSEYIRSFTDYKKTLILNIIKIIEGLDFNKFGLKNYNLSTKEFEYAFESLIETTFGNVKSSNYNPYAIWYINNKQIKTSELRPDTILIKDNVAYIIDAKYYKYGYKKEVISNYLPETSSVLKQISYAEHIDKNHKEIKKIYNIFILPTSSIHNYIEYVGYTIPSGKIGTKTYEKVYTFLIDLKKLINKVYSKEEATKILITELNKVK